MKNQIKPRSNAMMVLGKHIAFGIAEVIHDPILTGTTPGWIEEFGAGKISLADLAKNLNRLGFPQDKFVLGRVVNLEWINYLWSAATADFEKLEIILPGSGDVFKILIASGCQSLQELWKAEAKKSGENFKKSLQAKGFSGSCLVEVAGQKAQLLEDLRQKRYDLVILDRLDSKVGPLEILKEIKSCYPGTKFILVELPSAESEYNFSVAESIRRIEITPEHLADKIIKYNGIKNEHIIGIFALSGDLEFSSENDDNNLWQGANFVGCDTALAGGGVRFIDDAKFSHSKLERQKAIRGLRLVGGKAGLEGLFEVLDFYDRDPNGAEMVSLILLYIKILLKGMPEEALLQIDEKRVAEIVRELKACNETSSQRFRILLANAETELRNEWKEKLTSYFGNQIEIFVTNNGVEAVEKYLANTFDLVITEILLNGLNGMNVLAEIKIFDPQAWVWILTGVKSEAHKKRAGELGVDNYWHRNQISFEELRDKIEELIRFSSFI